MADETRPQSTEHLGSANDSVEREEPSESRTRVFIEDYTNSTRREARIASDTPVHKVGGE